MLAIFRAGSITKAAAGLYITQPALSKYLKNVETRVGVPLFSRIGNALVPTHVGRRYLAYAEEIAAVENNWETERTDLLGESRGTLVVAMPTMRAASLIPEVLPRFAERYPEVRIDLLEESHSVEKHLLASRGVDLVVYNETSPHPAMERVALGQEELVLIAPPNHPAARSARAREGCRYPWLDLARLSAEPFVLNPADQSTGHVAQRLLDDAGIDPKVVLRTRNSDVSIRLAAKGTAFSFCPESYVAKIHPDLRPDRYSVGNPRTEIVLYALYQKGRYLPSYARHFLELARETLPEAPREPG